MKQICKYLVNNERDALWGLYISTVGYEEILPGEPYPTKGHADGYYFDVNKGRILNEYQLLYITEGEGVFKSEHQKETRIKEGDLFLLFPGEWHSYHPDKAKGWKSYWIGFKGRNIDDRIKYGFLSTEKPIYHVGFSSDIVRLYENAYQTALDEAAYFQQMLAGIVNHLVGLMYSLERNRQLNKNRSHVDMINKARLRIRESLESELTIQQKTLQGVHGHLPLALPAGSETAARQRAAHHHRHEHQGDSLPAQLRVARLLLVEVPRQSRTQAQRVQKRCLAKSFSTKIKM